MADKVNIKSTGKRVSGAKGDAQSKRMKEIEQRQAADREAAAQAGAAKGEAERIAAEEHQAAQAEAERVQAEADAKAQAQREAVGKAGAAALSVGGAITASAVDNIKKGKLSITPKVAFFGIAALVIIALLLFIAWPRLSAALFPQPETHTTAQLSENAVMGNTKADISNAILGEARQKQELIVWEQDVQVDSEISQALANLAIFEKTKRIHSFGTGVYTVDMGKIDDAAIAVDEQTHTVTMTIPRTQLQYVTKDLEKTEFEDTEHALLGFGDLKLTQEQQNLLEQSIEDAMRAELESESCFADADAAALLVVYDVYQPLVVKIDDSYKLEVQFAQERA